MTGAGGTDLGGIGQQLNSCGELGFIQVIFHFGNAGGLNVIGLLGCIQSFHTDHKMYSFSLMVRYNNDTAFERFLQYANVKNKKQ